MKELAEKYLNNTCTKREAHKVLAWFRTREGRAFLEKKIDADLEERGVENDAEPKLKCVKDVRLNKEKHSAYYARRKKSLKRSLITKAAAVVLLILMGTGFYWIFQSGGGAKMQQKKYTTGPSQQEKITLADGTHIRLNRNSMLWVNTSGQYRKVKLQGEAFFKVKHNSQKPFVVSTSNALIQDIGTKFNVKAGSDKKNVQVAVVDGEVLFKSKKEPQKHASQEQAPKGQAVHLTKGQFGFLNAGQNRIKVDQFAVKNYLSWMDHHHRIVFVNAPLPKVGRQLERLYNVKCVFMNHDLKNMKITADFKADSLNKVLSVIAQTLHIKFKKKGNKIVWAH